MRILILNWRDIKNPSAGGAEKLTFELAKRWVKWGHQVTWFTAGFSGSKPEDKLEGIKIIRKGYWWSVQLFAAFYYLTQAKHEVDIVIDEVHWFPFFSRLYAPSKTILLVCETATELFPRLFPRIIAGLLIFLEQVYFYLYRKMPVLAISSSTRDSLVKQGFSKQNITVIPMGISKPVHLSRLPKEACPTLVFLGRLHPLKGTEEAIRALKMVKDRFPHACLWIIGTGSSHYLYYLTKLTQSLNLTNSVRFYGFVTEKRKYELLSRAHLLLVPSFQEGWGLIVSEAALVKTPSVSYRAAGLRDALEDGKTGILVNPQVESLAEATVKLLTQKQIYREIQQNAYQKALRSNWDISAKTTLAILKRLFR